MYKVASLARFAQSLSKQEAGGYWTAAHAPLMKLVSPLAGYVQSHVTGPLPLAAGVAERETFFDGYSCAWWESLSDFQHAVTTSAWQDVIDDGARIFDMDWLWNMSAHLEENVVVHGPRAPYKVVWVIRFKHGMTRSEGRDYWANVHGPIVEQLNAARYVQNHVVGPMEPMATSPARRSDSTDSPNAGSRMSSSFWTSSDRRPGPPRSRTRPTCST